MKTKIAIKNQDITPYGGIFYVEKEYDRLYSSLIDHTLGQRARFVGYQYSDIFRCLSMIYFCGGHYLEDITTLGRDFRFRPHSQVPSSDTIARGLKELSEDNTVYSSDSGQRYSHNIAERLNGLLLDMLLHTGQLSRTSGITLDFDHEFIPTDKYDALHSYKGQCGYFPGVASVGSLLVGVENRGGNTTVCFHQEDTLLRLFHRLEARGIPIARFRADNGSYTENVVRTVWEHSFRFYIRASNCKSRTALYEDYKDWKSIEINYEREEVASFLFTDFMEDAHLRLVVERKEIKEENGEQNLFGKRYIYRPILTNDWDMTEEEIVSFYRARGASEKNFDVQNNDFGWKHPPFSFMNQNAAFLLVTAMCKNFYLYLVDKLTKRKFEGLSPVIRMKRFMYVFVIVPAKWVKNGRRWILNLYTSKQYELISDA